MNHERGKTLSRVDTKPISIYLAGKVPKGAAEEASAVDWRAAYTADLQDAGDFAFLTPEDPTLDENLPEHVFGHDCYLVRECDIVVVNATVRLGAGTSQEMVIAKYFGKYVFTILPRDSHHRRSNMEMNGIHVPEWIHPFIFSMSDAIFEDVKGLRSALADKDGPLSKPPKLIDVVDAAIDAYIKHRVMRYE